MSARVGTGGLDACSSFTLEEVVRPGQSNWTFQRQQLDLAFILHQGSLQLRLCPQLSHRADSG